MHDIPKTGLKLQFTDDTAITLQSKNVIDDSAILTKDIELMNTYFHI